MTTLEARFLVLRASLEEHGFFERLDMGSLSLVETLYHKLLDLETEREVHADENQKLRHKVELKELQLAPCMDEIKSLMATCNEYKKQIIETAAESDQVKLQAERQVQSATQETHHLKNLNALYLSDLEAARSENQALREKIDELLKENYISHIDLQAESLDSEHQNQGSETHGYGKYPQRIERYTDGATFSDPGPPKNDDAEANVEVFEAFELLSPAQVYETSLQNYQRVVDALKAAHANSNQQDAGNDKQRDLPSEFLGDSNTDFNLIAKKVQSALKEEVDKLSKALADAVSPDYVNLKQKLERSEEEIEKLKLMVSKYEDPATPEFIVANNNNNQRPLGQSVIAYFTRSMAQSEKNLSHYKGQCLVLKNYVSDLYNQLVSVGQIPVCQDIKLLVENFTREEDYVRDLETKLKSTQRKLQALRRVLRKIKDLPPDISKKQRPSEKSATHLMDTIFPVASETSKASQFKHDNKEEQDGLIGSLGCSDNETGEDDSGDENQDDETNEGGYGIGVYYKKQYENLKDDYRSFYKETSERLDVMEKESKRLNDDLTRTLADKITLQEKFKKEKAVCLESKEKIKRLHKEKDDLSAMCFEMTNDKHAQLEIIDKLQTRVQELTKRIADLQSELGLHQKTQDQFDKITSDYQLQITEAKTYIEKLVKEKKENDARLEDVSKEVKAYQEKIGILNLELHDKRAQLQDKLVEINELYKHTKETMLQKNRELESVSTEMQGKLLEHKFEAGRLSLENNKYRQELRGLHTHTKYLEDSVKKLSRKIIDMEYNREVCINDKSSNRTVSSSYLSNSASSSFLPNEKGSDAFKESGSPPYVSGTP